MQEVFIERTHWATGNVRCKTPMLIEFAKCGWEGMQNLKLLIVKLRIWERKNER